MSKDMLQELKEQKIWVIYKKEEVNGRMTKVPYGTKGYLSGSNEKHRKSWVTYEEAVAAIEKNKADGVGFVIQPGYFFLDIDHQDLDSPLVQEIIQKFGSYTELSQSGEGIHIYGKCQPFKIPSQYDVEKKKLKLDERYYIRNSATGFELYVGGLTDRFAVFTGNAINECELKDCTEKILEFLEVHMRKPVKESKKKQASNEEPKKKKGKKSTESISDIILALCDQKNGPKFRELYYEGKYDEKKLSQSEADQSLCEIIAFRNDDVEIIDKIFRKSELYRPKWEEASYREKTIANALEKVRELKEEDKAVFKREKERPDFIYLDKKGKEHVSASLLARHIRSKIKYILVKDDAYQTTRVYVYKNGHYIPYDNEMLSHIIKQEIANHNVTLVRMGIVKEVLQNLKAESEFVRTDELDANESIINFENGILEVSANGIKLKEHSSDVYSTIQIPCRWEGKAYETPVFDAYMKTLTNGDKNIEQLLLQFMGVTISNIAGYRMKKALFMVGKGDSGKSQLKALTESLIGNSNFAATELKDLEARFGTSAVYGKRLAGSADMGFMSINELRTFKKLTGGDAVQAEYKGQNSFSFTYKGILWFCMNKLPKFGGDDGQWVYDRIVVVRCDNSIPLEKQDKDLLKKMYAERQGIIFKAVQALQKVIANGYRYDEPESVKEARVDYQKINSTVISFFEECMRERVGYETRGLKNTTGNIYTIYTKWCRDNNNGFQKSAKEFREDLCKYLGKTYQEITTRINGNTYFTDYVLTEETTNHYTW